MGKKSESSKKAPAKLKKVAAASVIAEPVAPVTAPPAAEKPAKKTLKKPAAKPATASKASKAAFTNDDVALRAYFIAEKRHKHGIHGDPHLDWVEAEKQLVAESKKQPVVKKAAKKA